MKTVLVALFGMILIVSAASAAPKNKGQQADTNHPNIHDKVGQGPGANANANPNGNNGKGSTGGEIHGIGNNPGQSGDKPGDDGVKGFANELETVHGGIGDVNRNAD